MLKEKIPCDAIFCANDQMAVGALKACEEAGNFKQFSVSSRDVFRSTSSKPNVITFLFVPHPCSIISCKSSIAEDPIFFLGTWIEVRGGETIIFGMVKGGFIL